MEQNRSMKPLAAFGVALLTFASGPAASASEPEVVERGRYLVTAGGCSDCHTPKKMGPHGPVLDESRLLSGTPEPVIVEPGS
jgi:mono/diheme cytochrome c family protein